MHITWRMLRVSMALTFFGVGLSLAGQQIIETLPSGSGPVAIAVNSVTNKIYIVASGQSSVTVIDGNTNRIQNVPVGTGPSAVAINQVTNKIYVVNESTVTVIDGLTNDTTSVGIGGEGASSIAVNPTTNKIYVPNSYTNDVTVIDGVTLATTSVATGLYPRPIAVNPSTNKIYVVNVESGSVTVIDGATLSTNTVAVGQQPIAIDVNSQTNKIYVANNYASSVTVIDGTNLSTRNVTTGNAPIAVAVNAQTNKVYVSNNALPLNGGSTVTVIDGSTLSTTTVPVGTEPVGVAVNPITNKIYVVNQDQLDGGAHAGITIIDGATNSTTTIPDNQEPWVMALNPVTNLTYVANAGNNTVSVIGWSSPATLTVSTSGTGNVTSTDGLIRCPGTCSHTYPFNTPVTLNASPGQYYTFSGWGGACSGTGSCNIVMVQSFSVTATFAPVLYTLTVVTTGNGTVSSVDGYIHCPGTCSHDYLENSQVTLNASPTQGWSFAGWGGNCTGTGSCTLTMTQNFFVAATFTQNPVTLTVSIAGDGSVASTDGYINCPETCQHTYDPGTPVTLNATAASGWAFSGWTGSCSGIGACNITMTDNLAVTGVFVEPGHGDEFTSAMPCRLVDTRQGSPIQGGTAQSFIVPQLEDCNIPGTATAYSLNVTVVPHRPLNYLTIWPTGEAQPFVSTMNSPDGRVKANAAIVPAGTSGAVSVFVTDTSDVILDIDGYFAPAGSQTLQFYPLTPCRVVDTRSGSQQPQGLGPPYLGDMETRDLPIPDSPCLSGIHGAQAYSFNVTAVPYPSGQSENYITLWPSDQTQPLVSTLNNYTATVVANAAIVPAAADGSIKVFAYNSTDLILDINGYFAAPGQGGYSFYPVAPCRAYDSRDNNGQPFSGEKTVNVADSPCAPPDNAAGYVFNATVVPSPTLGYLTLWADGQTQPVVSTLNAYDGFITSNMAIVPNGNGSLDAYADGMTHLILDISGYFGP